MSISSTGGIDFIGINKTVSFTASNQEHCVDITILKDASDEVEESFKVELTLKYAPFDIPLDITTVTIGSTGRLAMVKGAVWGRDKWMDRQLHGWMNRWRDGGREGGKEKAGRRKREKA